MGKLLSINLLQRVLVAVVGIPFLIWVVKLGGLPFFLLLLVLSLAATYEFFRLALHKAAPPPLWLALFLTVILQLNFYTGIIDTWELVLGVVLLLFVIELFRNEGSALLNLGSLLTALLYVNLCFGALLQLRRHGHDGEGEALVLLLFVCVWAADISAYFGGSMLGGRFIRRKLFERLSPHKTWEGYLAGLSGSVAASAICLQLMPQLSSATVLSAGVMIGVVSPAGDLIESMFKRDAGVKDSSALIPGHGGVLDRFDTIMFVSPIVYFLSSLL
ncbi:MAG: phosphatidate cytidylyltransferase [Chlorobium sp.]|jgi:phosphatidate cytidylyltransferase|uniref:phosphatidate cytidylyltransferase n=1 Tax=Chlorobium sp. TaxID=1095 RepID=UPI0025BAB7BE|nr:phosphatidate cytidylyltransferase [Chlorobium sp.]MCF8216992.1 phosphatidate cytidylyltransferase [Chlorobium sp.]MCF8271822.1 phosphatidate cytidylyltransferase [Chlorobium sp.]MCF8288209.1 phosphatidate cytidylyltransferase [Chlorobium sp.]MCF8291802.1 phosphatidate cytidylyltransferase [Chlorobium sp.]MCF8385910.1 phosphatidate cytidylyltransferase [Chlorobium sp.]